MFLKKLDIYNREQDYSSSEGNLKLTKIVTKLGETK